MDDLLSTREVARLAGVGPSAVKRWAERGSLRCVRTAGGHRRFARAAVETFLRAAAPRRPVRARAMGRRDSSRPRDALGLEALLLPERARLGAW